MYHFLQRDGGVYPKKDESRHLEKIDPDQLSKDPPREDAPPIYSVSPDGLAEIARRGVCMLVVHSTSRAPVARAALKRRSVNLIVITEDAARKLLKL